MALNRRALLRNGLIAGGGAVLLGGTPRIANAAPAFVRAGRPQLTHGVQSADVTANRAVMWARADRPARMLVDVSTRPDFAHARTIKGPLVTPDTDLTGKTFLTGLPADREVHYRVRLDDDGLLSAPTVGTFRTAPRRRRDVRFVWAGDLAGQGWGINPDLGGYRIWEFVSGPLNAGTFGPNTLENTFGPQLRFAKTPPTANASPADGFQFFGEVAIDASSEVLTARLRDLDGAVLYTVDLSPVR